jgi:hypothetical protein
MAGGATRPRRTDSTLVKALARAFRWRGLLDVSNFISAAELAAHGGIAPSYVTRVLRLTLLAPDIIEAIVDGRHGPSMELARVLESVTVDWAGQHTRLD